MAVEGAEKMKVNQVIVVRRAVTVKKDSEIVVVGKIARLILVSQLEELQSSEGQSQAKFHYLFESLVLDLTVDQYLLTSYHSMKRWIDHLIELHLEKLRYCDLRDPLKASWALNVQADQDVAEAAKLAAFDDLMHSDLAAVK